MDINKINFTDKVREIFTLSHGKAESNKNLHIDVVHIFDSITESSCLGKSLLEKFGIDMHKLNKAIQDKIDLLPISDSHIDKIEITTKLAKILNNAYEKALRLGDKFVATDLILLSILEDKEASHFIHIHTVNVGINIKKTRLVCINDYGYGDYYRCEMFLVSYQSR